MQGALSDSSDYGSDFTPDEEEILSELLARVDQSGGAAARAGSVSAGDIEGYGTSHENSLWSICSPKPKVLGREKRPIFSWVHRQQQLASKVESSQVAEYGNALGTVFSFSASLTPSFYIFA